MPWTLTYYPVSMKNLSPQLREKAIEIANALLAEGMDEGKAIRVAIAKAKEWARHHSGESSGTGCRVSLGSCSPAPPGPAVLPLAALSLKIAQAPFNATWHGTSMSGSSWAQR